MNIEQKLYKIGLEHEIKNQVFNAVTYDASKITQRGALSSSPTHNTQEAKMANNPYQIRYDVLNMAKEMLDKQYDIQMEVAYKAMDMYKDNAEQALEAYKNYIPKAITPDEIKAQADKLYEFVTTKEK